MLQFIAIQAKPLRRKFLLGRLSVEWGFSRKKLDEYLEDLENAGFVKNEEGFVDLTDEGKTRVRMCYGYEAKQTTLDQVRRDKAT